MQKNYESLVQEGKEYDSVLLYSPFDYKNFNVDDNKNIIWIGRPPRNYEYISPSSVSSEYVQEAEIEVISSLKKGEKTFTSEDIRNKLPELGFFNFDWQKELDRIKKKYGWMQKYPAKTIFCSSNDISRIISYDKETDCYTFEVCADSANITIAEDDSPYGYSVSGIFRKILIPQQLADAKLILLLPKEKLPLTSKVLEDGRKFVVTNRRDLPEKFSWKNSHYQYSATQMQNLLLSEEYMYCNYAIVDTDYVSIDCDDFEGFKEVCPGIDTLINDTFTIKSGRTSGDGYHLYLKCDNVPSEYDGRKITVRNSEDDDVGDVRIHAETYTVGPNSMHPSGNRYKIQSNKPIQVIGWDALYTVLEPAIKKSNKPLSANKRKGISNVLIPKSDSIKGDNPLSELNINCLDVLMPTNPTEIAPGEFQGGHPIHGSTTGHNLSVCKNMWYCFRCGAGGGLIQAIVVADKIRDCGDHQGPYSKVEWDKIDAGLKRRDPKGFAEYKKLSYEQYKERKRDENNRKIKESIEKLNAIEAGGLKI